MYMSDLIIEKLKIAQFLMKKIPQREEGAYMPTVWQEEEEMESRREISKNRK